MNSQRILSLGGLLLFLLSISYGLYYEIFLRTAQQQSLVYNLDMALNMATKGDLTTASAFAGEFGRMSQAMAGQARIAQHLAIAGTMLVAPLWLVPKLDISERLQRILALFMVFGGLLLGAGEFIQTLGLAQMGWYMALTGSIWLGIGLFGYLVFGLLFVWLYAEQKTKRG
jgi:hypothetical protein